MEGEAGRLVPFRVVLNRWLFMLLGVVCLPLGFLVMGEPWASLDRMIDRSNGVLAGSIEGINLDDLKVSSELALAVVRAGPVVPDQPETAGAFLLAAEYGSCPEEVAIRSRVAEESSEMDPAALVTICQTWVAWLASRSESPAEVAAFWRVQRGLQQAHAATQQVNLVTDDVYLTVDTGKAPSGFFHDSIAFVGGAHHWWQDPIYPGQRYVVGDGEFWRASYLPELGGRPGGYAHNPLHAPLLPLFEVDEWGSWFSVWTSREPVPRQYITLTMDIDATAVRSLMGRATASVVAGLLMVGLIAWLVAQRLSLWVSRPVLELQRGAQAVLDLDYSYTVPTVGQGEFITLIQTFNKMVRGLSERANLLATLEKLLSKELAGQAAEKGLELGGDEVTASVLFTDFVGFSTLTRERSASEVVSALNDYFGILVPIIKKWGGFPDKYIGDAIVALFGTPVKGADHALRAVQCSIEMQRRLRSFNAERRAAGKLVFEMRVGVNSGTMMVGAIGCDEKLEFTSIGETTNLANRMESICPIGHVMMGAATWELIKATPLPGTQIDGPRAREVKGYEEPVEAVALYVDRLEVLRNPRASLNSELYRYQQR